MSLWSRIANVFRGERLSREIDRELQSHIEEAISRGREPGEARRAFGSPLRQREESRDLRLIPWLDSLRADALGGWRQLKKRKVTSAAAILSLALAIGACTSAFRLIDGLLLRPLPVAGADRLYYLSRQGIGPEGKPQTFDGWAYPAFRKMRAAVKDDAGLIAISYADWTDLTYGPAREIEKAHLQYVSGWMFGAFGLRPAGGWLFTENDDLQPGAHPVAVLSHDYWSRRFGKDPAVVGRTFRMRDTLYEIAGVSGKGFTGTETGTVVDIFVPTMMNPAVSRSNATWFRTLAQRACPAIFRRRISRSNATWFRTLAQLKPGVSVERVRERLDPICRAVEAERVKGLTGLSRQRIANFINQKVLMEPAAAGISEMQKNYRVSLTALGVLVGLVMLIACANVANLMTAQAAARSREMALRVSIGAGRRRLVQLVLVESAWIAFLAAAAGVLFAWWSAPFVVGMIDRLDGPPRLYLPMDMRVLGFCLALTVGVTVLFGLGPALRASAINPASALKGGEDPHSRRRTMHALIAVQVAFCFLVLFGAGLFVATFDRLSNQSPGFSAERLLTVDTVPQHPQPPAAWDQAAGFLRQAPGVELVALADWRLMNGDTRNNDISIDGIPPAGVLAYFRSISPGWTEAMKIPFIAGRDFRASDTSPGAAIVNETFARQFFNGEDPVGKSFLRGNAAGGQRYQVVGLVRDARYRSMREPMLPVAYVPLHSIDAHGAPQPIDEATFIIRTAVADPLALASTLRKMVHAAQPEFRVSDIQTQAALVEQQTIRERLLAMLALFFATVALLLAGIGLYGVLDYSVLQRRREIGIRMAIGAAAGNIAWRVTADVFSMVLAGGAAGLLLGIASGRYIASLLYGVKATDLGALTLPGAGILAVALPAAVPAVIRAVRIDPVTALRSE